MENFEQKTNRSIEDIIVSKLDLIQDTEHFLKLESLGDENSLEINESVVTLEDSINKNFEGIKEIKPDNLLRPEGSTTIFTTAGVQHIETTLNETGDLKDDLYIIKQPVIRSQFMDKIKEGFSTSFTNYSIISTESNPEEFSDLTKKLVKLIIDLGVNLDRLRFTIENKEDEWGNRKFSKTVVTIYLDTKEVGEGVYIKDYPVSEDKLIDISDVCFGLERFNYLVKGGNYFSGMEDYYSIVEDPEEITPLLDSIKTSILMVNEGVEPAHKDPGYRLRQLIKRFVDRNKNHNIDSSSLIESFIKQIEFEGVIVLKRKPEDIRQIIISEIDRSKNVKIMTLLEKFFNLKLKSNKLNFKQKPESFIEDISSSLSEENYDDIMQFIKDNI